MYERGQHLNFNQIMASRILGTSVINFHILLFVHEREATRPFLFFLRIIFTPFCIYAYSFFYQKFDFFFFSFFLLWFWCFIKIIPSRTVFLLFQSNNWFCFFRSPFPCIYIFFFLLLPAIFLLFLLFNCSSKKRYFSSFVILRCIYFLKHIVLHSFLLFLVFDLASIPVFFSH